MAAEKLKNINGPVYLTEESGHHYGEFIKAVDTDAKDLTGPVYMSKDSGKNVFSKIYKQAQKVKELVGPVCMSEDVSHGCSEIQKQAQQLLIKAQNIQVLLIRTFLEYFGKMILFSFHFIFSF